MSDGATRSMTSNWPERRLARRTVESTIGVNATLSKWTLALFQYAGWRSRTIRSWATRSTNLNGPEHTGLAPKFAPSAFAAFGETIIPARSASAARIGVNGADRLSLTLVGSTTSTLATGRSA